MRLELTPSTPVVRSAVLTAVVLASLSAPARAQTPARISLDTVFFADNGEFFSPFRTGETILGSWQRVDVDLDLGRPAALKLGLYALERDGSQRRSELARPVVSLTIANDRQRFVIGTLETTAEERRRTGPDVTTPHDLLPALAVETSWFSRAYEAGAQWRVNTERLTQDVWFNYQKLVTSEHRELFDGGVVGKYDASPHVPIALLYQWHVVHHGGQQFHTGPVSDSFGYGPGLLAQRTFPMVGRASLEAYALFSYDRPDRQQPDLTTQGHARFVRITAEKRNWRAHLLAWQGRSFKHEGGDPNYLSEYPDGTTAHGHRDYGEAGLARRFTLTPTVDLEASGRAHLVQGTWGYSYRVVATVHVPLWTTGTGGRATPPPADSDGSQ